MPWDNERQEQPPPADNDEQKPQFTPPPSRSHRLPPQLPKAPAKSTGKANGCLIALLTLFGVLGLMGVCAVFFAVLGLVGIVGSMAGMDLGEGSEAAFLPVRERTLSGAAGDPKVAVIPVSGLLIRDGGNDPLRALEAMLARAEADTDVHAIILSVNSGGGGVTTSDLMYKAIKDFKEKTEMQVVVLVNGIAASGAYYISCAADHIVAQETSLTGSIGVLFPIYDVSEMLGKIGVTDRTVKSGEFKTLGSATAERTEEQRKAEQAILQGIIDAAHRVFVDRVEAGRPGLTREAIEALADGRIYTSGQALENGLIDEVGYMEAAIAVARSSEARVHVVQYDYSVPFLVKLLSNAEKPGVNVQVGPDLKTILRQRPMYLWLPER
jgi:protease IV